MNNLISGQVDKSYRQIKLILQFENVEGFNIVEAPLSLATYWLSLSLEAYWLFSRAMISWGGKASDWGSTTNKSDISNSIFSISKAKQILTKDNVDASVRSETWVGRVFFSTVVAWERLDWSYPSIPALNFRCSNSWAIASLDGKGFFSIVSAFFRLDLSNSETVLREESLASSVCRIAVGEAGSLVRTSFKLSFAKPSTPWRKENIKEEVTTMFADLEHSLDRLLSLDLLLARQHHLLLRLCRLQGVGGEALDSSEDSLVVLLLLHVLRCRQHILLS